MQSGYCSTSDMVRRVRSQTPVNVVEEAIEPSPVFAAFEAIHLVLSFVHFNSNSQDLIVLKASASVILSVLGFGGQSG